jgi:hypothetical protein
MSDEARFQGVNSAWGFEIGEVEIFEYDASKINSLTDDAQYAIRFRSERVKNMQDMAKAMSIWKNYLPANSRRQLEQRARTYWALASLMLAQCFFSEGDIVACTNQLRAARTLWNHGGPRWRRLTLQAKVLLYRVFGRRAISAMRALRRRMLPRYKWLRNENGS